MRCAELAERGIEAHAVDLADLDGLPDAVRTVAAGRPVAAITMLDVLEHLPDPSAPSPRSARRCAESMPSCSG